MTTDIYASYNVNKNFLLSIGSDNLFNVHPNLGYVPGVPTRAYDGETGGAWDLLYRWELIDGGCL